MRITIEIPEWAQERHIFIMAGIEMLAYKLYGEDIVNIKTVRCDMCGDCCRNLKFNIEPIGPDNACIHLEESKNGQSECILALNRPFPCSTGLHRKGRTPGCCIEYDVRGIF